MSIIATFRYMHVLVPVLTGTLIFGAFAFGVNQLRSSDPTNMMKPTISVEATSKVTAKPDIASFSFNVHVEEETQEAAQTKAAEREQAILSFLKEQGVAETDLKTSNYNLSPRYEYQIETNCRINCNGKQVQIGYQVDEMVTVTVRDLDRAGELLAGAGARGAENISNLSYRIDDTSVFREEAVATAIEKAREKAEARAKSLGKRLGKLQYFSENSDNEPYYNTMFSAKAEMALGGDMAPSLPAGENEISVTVSATYFLK